MKRIIVFLAVIFGLSGVTLAQTTEKVKTKIEGQGFKKKIKTESESQKVLTSTTAHPAYAHHYVHHYATTKHRYTTAKRHTPYRQRHVTHTRAITHRHLAHYKKIKRMNKNGEYKVKYKA